MSTLETKSPSGPKTTGGDGAKPTASGTVSWKDSVPAHVDAADTMPQSQVAGKWAKIVAAVGAGNSEDVVKQIKAAVYTYGLINGTSRAGAYNGEMQLKNGKIVPASIIPTSVGSMEIRPFYRANMVESYHFFKESGHAESLPRVLAKAAQLGIPANAAFAMADWMDSCPLFTPAEADAHLKSFTQAIQRSRRARGGNTLEAVEDAKQERILQAQGPLEQSIGRALDY